MGVLNKAIKKNEKKSNVDEACNIILVKLNHRVRNQLPGLSTSQLLSRSPFNLKENQEALSILRDLGKIHCVDGIWYKR